MDSIQVFDYYLLTVVSFVFVFVVHKIPNQNGITPSLTAICRRRMTTSVSGGSGGRLRFAADAIHWSTIDVGVRYYPST